MSPETIQESLKGILEEKGVQILHSESDDPVYETLQRIAAEENPSPSEVAALEAIQEKHPEIAEMLLTGNFLADQDQFIKEIIEQVSFMKLEDETRALTKEDLVKYRSTMINLRDEDTGKLYKSKYAKI